MYVLMSIIEESYIKQIYCYINSYNNFWSKIIFLVEIPIYRGVSDKSVSPLKIHFP